MSIAFNADEVMEMAEQLERNGAKFYRDAAESVKDDDAKKKLLQLADMEDQHEKIFKKLRSDLKLDEKEATLFDPKNESLLYLRGLADTRVFFEKKIDLTSIKEILKSALEAEKDSILFYIGMKDLVPEHMGRKRMDTIIREEMGHIQLLSKELLALK